jgi:hypothetical protein
MGPKKGTAGPAAVRFISGFILWCYLPHVPLSTSPHPYPPPLYLHEQAKTEDEDLDALLTQYKV